MNNLGAGMHAPLDLSRSRLALIYNAKAGKKDAAARAGAIRDALAPRVRAFEMIPIRNGRDITPSAQAAVRGGAEVVLALGGDGTQAAVANALVNSNATMGVLPGGTFNYFARELGLDSLETALDTILQGHVLHRDVGQVNGRIFLNNASLGLYPHILRSRENVYRRWGRSRMAAYWSVLLGLRDMRRPMRLRVTLNGQTHDFHTPMAFVARSAYQLDSLGLEGGEGVRRGQFALFLAKGQSRLEMATASLRLAMGLMKRDTDFDMVLADAFEIETDTRRKRVALDGEQGKMVSPLRMQVLKGALRVLVPPEDQPRASGQ